MGSWLSDVGSWLSDNKDLVGAIGDIGLGVLQDSRQRSSGSNIADYYSAAAQQDYANQKAQYDAYVDYMNKANAYRAQASAAANAAAAATDRNRKKAAKRAQKIFSKGVKASQGVYEPYMQAGAAALPAMTSSYSNSMGAYNSLLGQFMTPQHTASLFSLPKSIFEMSIPKGK